MGLAGTIGERMGRGEGGRSRNAELVTLVISIVILMTLLAGLAWSEASRGDARARITVRPIFDAVYEHDGAYYLPLTITNVGDRTTDVLRVNLEREVAGEDPEEVDLAYTFVAGGEEVEGVAVFDERPTADNITVDVIGMTEP